MSFYSLYYPVSQGWAEDPFFLCTAGETGRAERRHRYSAAGPSSKRLPDNLSRRIRNKRQQSIADLLQRTCEAARFAEWLDLGLGGPLTKKPKLAES